MIPRPAAGLVVHTASPTKTSPGSGDRARRVRAGRGRCCTGVRPAAPSVSGRERAGSVHVGEQRDSARRPRRTAAVSRSPARARSCGGAADQRGERPRCRAGRRSIR